MCDNSGGRVVTILETTPRNPISLMGSRAAICWGADASDEKKNYQRGYDCMKSDHGRLLEFIPVDIVIEGYSARVMREYMRHVGGGLTCLQASTRYINYNNFEVVVPPSIKNSKETLTTGDTPYDLWCRAITEIQFVLEKMQEMGIPKEDSAMLLPLGMTTKLVDHKNLRNLADMSHKRLCKRAFWEFRDLFKDITEALNEYSDEWKEVTSLLFKPTCAVLGHCPEKKGCGRYKNEQ